MEEEKTEELKEVHFGKFNIFLVTKTAQNSFGLKNGDYERYRRYCAHKVFKLRHNMGIKYGTKMKFLRKDLVKEKPNQPKILQFLLFNAEKNWALANQTKFSAMRKPSQKSRARFYSIKKLVKALEWAKKLHSICNQKADSVTQLQAQAYELFLEGSLQFERQRWSIAQSKLIACRQIMPDLAKVSDSLSEKVFKQKVDQIEQTIKFCNFKISKGRELSITEIVELRKGGDTSLSNLMDSLAEKWMSNIKLSEEHGEIHFGKERYPIKEELIIKQKAKIDVAQHNIQEFKAKWLAHKQDQKLFEELLSFYSELVLQIEEAIKLCDSQRQDSKKKEKYTQGQLQILKKVSLLFLETKINTYIDRNMIIFRSSYELSRGRKSTPQTIAKLLTNTMTFFQELADVTKQKGSISNTFDIQQVQTIDAKSFYLRTMRLLFVGQVYFNNNKLKEAYGLWCQCQRCIKILLSKEEMNQTKSDGFIGSLIDLKSLLNSVRTNKVKCVISNFQSDEGKKEDLSKKMGEIEIGEKKIDEVSGSEITLQTLISEHKDDCPLSLEEISKIPIIDLPGHLQPIPTRPIFFDIFYLNLTYPSVDSKIKKAEPGKTSWWGRLFK